MSPVERNTPHEAPPRLIEGADGAGESLRALERHLRPEAQDEARAWRRLAPRLPAVGASRWFWSGAFVTAAAVAALLLVRRPMTPHEAVVAPPGPVFAPVVVPTAPIAPPSAPPRHARGNVDSSPAPARRLALSKRPIALPPGQAALAGVAIDEATVELAPRSKARATADRAWVRVVLQRGQVGLHVAKRVAGGPGFEVVAGAYRFRVLGTRFRVARGVRGGAPVELWVDEGRVAVSRKGRALGVVVAGGHWDTRAGAPRETRLASAHPVRASSKAKAALATRSLARVVPAAPEAAVRAPDEAPTPAPRARCAELADEAATARDAVGCYGELSRGTGLAAETALYEVARLRRDVLGDGPGALAALEESRARFPAGLLRQEVDLSIVELLPKLNRHREAIDEIGRLLSQRGDRDVERAAELHVLRGNIYREVLEDCARAERDYAAAEASRAPVVGDATFFRGVCLQAVRRPDEARAVFERYLASGTGRFADEARRRLGRLR